jgi:hypothetical protein
MVKPTLDIGQHRLEYYRLKKRMRRRKKKKQLQEKGYHSIFIGIIIAIIETELESPAAVALVILSVVPGIVID